MRNWTRREVFELGAGATLSAIAARLLGPLKNVFDLQKNPIRVGVGYDHIFKPPVSGPNSTVHMTFPHPDLPGKSIHLKSEVSICLWIREDKQTNQVYLDLKTAEGERHKIYFPPDTSFDLVDATEYPIQSYDPQYYLRPINED